MKFLTLVKNILNSVYSIIEKEFCTLIICIINLLVIILSAYNITTIENTGILFTSFIICLFSVFNIILMFSYIKKYEKLKFDVSLNEKIYKEKDKLLNELEFEMKEKIDINCQLTLNQIFDLYESGLAIRKYRISKYHIDPKTKEMHIYCNMSTYTKMNLNREILPKVKYHIEGTNVII